MQVLRLFYMGFRFLILFFFSIFPLLTWGADIHFQTLGSVQGLSQSSAISIWQDKVGRIWLGNDALNCYDGETVKVYRFSEYFEGVEDSNIHTITGNDSTLFIIAENNLISLDLKTETFHLTNINTTSVYCLHNLVYYFSNGSLNRYDSKTLQIEEIMPLPKDILSIRSMVSMGEDELWLATSTGVYIVDLDKRIIKDRLLSDEDISKLFKDSHDYVWLMAKSRNVYLATMKDEVTVVDFEMPKNEEFNTDIYCMEEDVKGSVWMGTLSGLYQFSNIEREAGKAALQNHLFAESTIFSLFSDHQGTLWVGSYYGDVRYFNPEIDNYTYYPTDENHPARLHGAVIGEITEDSKGNLFIATEGSGINILTHPTGDIQHITISDGLPQNKIRSLWFDEKYNRLYISGYMKGLAYLDVITRKIHPVKDGAIDHIYQRIIEKIIPYKDYLILLTQDGLFKLDRNTLTITFFLDEPELRELCSGIIRTIHIDERDILWVSSFSRGLFTIDLKRKTTLNFYGDGLIKGSTVPSAVLNICGDTKRGLYMTTLKSGVLSYNADRDTFTVFNEEKQHLLSDICYNLAFSWYGNLIVTTNRGVSILNLSSRHEVNSARHMLFTASSPLTALSGDCGLYVSSYGDKIYVGGLYGLLTFSERDLVLGNDNYSLFFSSLGINNSQVVSPSEFLPLSFPFMKKLTLPYNKNTVSVRFASSNYLSTHASVHEYKLEGLDEYWTRTNHKDIIYNSLRPGKYKLLVREVGNIDKSIQLDIIITSPFWATSPAIFIYIVFLLFLLGMIIRFNKSRTRLKISLEMERKEIHRIEEANRNKMNFFMNISNEFRSPLTLILSQIDRLLGELPSSGQKKLDNIKRQAVRLQDLATELLDFRKIEQNSLNLQIKGYNVTDFMREIYSTYTDYASEKQITYRYTHPEDLVYAWFDQKQMQKVIYNILVFIFKYASEKDLITLSLHQTSKWIEIKIIHQGIQSDDDGFMSLLSLLNNETDNLHDLDLLPDGGIGIIFSKGIMNLHKGKISVTKEGNRAVYLIGLQQGNIHFTEKELQFSKESIEPFSTTHLLSEKWIEDIEAENLSGKRLQMLLIEDDLEIRMLLKESFSLVYDVIEVKDAESGYEYAISELPDIIVSEVNLPGMSGVEMCSMLKSNIKTLHIPIVLITSQPSYKQNIDSIRCGADHYIVKPFNIELLFLRCNHLVKNMKSVLDQFSNQMRGDLLDLATNTRDQEFMAMANQVIEEHLGNPEFDTSIWSKDLGIGRTRLFSQIKNITGMTPNDYILHVKLNKSVSLLLENLNLTIAEIAYQLGFASPAYFSKCFKKKYGVTPAEYRKKK